MTLSSVCAVFVSRSNGWCRTVTHIGLLFWWLFFHGFVQFHQGNAVMWPNVNWVRIPVRPLPAWEKGNIQFLFDIAPGAQISICALVAIPYMGTNPPTPLDLNQFLSKSWDVWHSDEKPCLLEVWRGSKTSRWHFCDLTSDWNTHVTSAVSLCERFVSTENLKFNRCHLRNVT
jgi:hypothetical protein